MPINKYRLSKAKEQKYRSCLEELRVGGANIDIPVDWDEETRPLDIVIRPDGSTEVFDDPHGYAIYCISVRLIARQAPLILSDCFCETEWDHLQPMSLPREKKLPARLRNGDDSLTFASHNYSRAKLLNDRIETELRFSHAGQVLEGLILFAGFDSIPDCYRGRFTPFTLTFVDEFDHATEVTSRLFVNREAKGKTVKAQTLRTLQATTETQSEPRTPGVEENGSPDASVKSTTENGSGAGSPREFGARGRVQ